LALTAVCIGIREKIYGFEISIVLHNHVALR